MPLYVFYSAVLFLFILNIFIGSDGLHYVIGLLAIPMFIVSFLKATRLFKILGTIFMSIGLGLFLYSGLTVYDIPLKMTGTMQLLAFLTVLPWLNSVVRAGRFDRRINQLMNANVSTLGKLYVRSSLTTFILTSFINLSALSLSQQVLQENMRNFSKWMRDSFISRTTLRAFAVAVAWSPVEIMVAMAVDGTGVSYFVYLPWLLIFAATSLVIDMVWGNRSFQTHLYEGPADLKLRTFTTKQIVMQIGKLLIALAAFLMLVVTIGNLFAFNFILTVTLVILPFAFGWAILMRRLRSFLMIGWKTWKMRTNSLQNFVVLFLSLAFFTGSLYETPFLLTFQKPFLLAAEQPILVLLLIQFTYLAMSMIGVHPVAVIAVLTEMLTPLFVLINPLSIGIVLITGGLATATVGTYGVTVTLTSMNTQQNPYRITARNMPFALLYGGIGTMIAYFLL